MSFRFCERLYSPAGRGQGTADFNARGCAAIPARPADYGRPGRTNVEVPVAPLLRALFGRALLLGRGPLAAVLEELRGALRRDRLDRIPCSQARIRLAVRHIRAETPLLQDDRLLADRILAELLQRGRGRAAAALLRLGQLGEGLLERDREHLLLGLERARLLAALDVRPVTAVCDDHLLAVDLAERARQREQ